MLIFIIGAFFTLLLLPFIGAWSLVALGIALIIGGLAYWAIPDCPRQIMGYNCRQGNPRYPEGCDHSPETVMAAKMAVMRNRR